MFAAEIRRKRVDRMCACKQWRWHLDEINVKINGATHYLWRAVDHEGEVLESFVIMERDRKDALKLLKKSMKRHGRTEVIVTGRLRSYGPRSRIWAAVMTAKWGAGSTTGRRTRTCRSDDGNERCCGSGACERCRSSPQSMPRSIAIAIRSARSIVDTISRPTAPPLSPSGADSSRPNTLPGLGN